MLFADPLSPEEIQTLEAMHKNHPRHAPRIRAHAVLLSHTGFKLSKIASIYGVCRQTAATWVNAWEDGGICALLDKPRSGRPRILCGEAEVDALQSINQSPRSLKKVLAELLERFSLSLSTLKRVCKRANLNWKRVRKSLRSKRDPDLFEQSRQQLATLIEQSKQQEIISTLHRQTVLVMDNASVHKSYEFQENIERWPATRFNHSQYCPIFA